MRHLNELGVAFRAPTAGKAILVNIPAFELIAFENGEPAFRSRVIVGSPGNPTPVIETYATAVRFRPTWRPTPSMIASGEYRDGVRAPGAHNPLGLAALRLAPGLLIYLHDTNQRALFDRPDRALSHGCVRVERWDELFAWVLDMNVTEVRRLAAGSATFDMPTRPIPVELGYFTTFPDEEGRPQAYEDIYRLGERAAGPPTRLRETSAIAPACAPAPG